MTNISVLKIESNQGVLLVSKNARQEIFPKSKIETIRNINRKVLSQTQPITKCIIETQDIPDFSILKPNSEFRIYSIIKLRQYGVKVPQMDYVKDSLELFDDFITFRPIFSMILTNFSHTCKNNNPSQSIWKLEFEDI